MNDSSYRAVDGLRQVCHDIRQPIAAILALAEAAMGEAGLPQNVRGRLEQIADLAEWQSEVVEDSLRATEPDQPGAASSDVVQVVNEALAAERATWPGDMVFRWPAEPVFAPLSPVILRRVVGNLLANAARAAGPSGRVRVEVGCRDGGTVVIIEDSGPGFGRIAWGSGLGLFAAARQATLYRGMLECGRGRDGGGMVRLWIPSGPAQAPVRTADATCSV